MRKKKDVAKLADAARRSLGIDDKSQRALLRQAKRQLDLTDVELATLLGKKRSTVRAWLAPDGVDKHRTMPDSSRLLLSHILKEHRASKARR